MNLTTKINKLILIVIIYRDALKQQYNLGQYFLEVSIEDISSFNEMLAHILQKQPSDNLPLVIKAYYFKLENIKLINLYL